MFLTNGDGVLFFVLFFKNKQTTFLISINGFKLAFNVPAAWLSLELRKSQFIVTWFFQPVQLFLKKNIYKPKLIFHLADLRIFFFQESYRLFRNKQIFNSAFLKLSTIKQKLNPTGINLYFSSDSPQVCGTTFYYCIY